MKTKKAKRLLSGFIILIFLVFVSYFFGMKAGVFNSKEEVTSDIVKEQLVSVKELTTLKYRYTNVASFENDNEFYGIKIPFTTKKFIISYDGEISAGIDLDKAKVDINYEKKSINISLPKAKILAHQIDEDSLTIFDEEESIFNQLKIKDFSEFRKNEMKKTEQELLEKGFLEEASNKSKDAIIEILNINPLIKDEYTVKVN